MSGKKQGMSKENNSIQQLQRALFYESQFRNAILSDALCFYDANITHDRIESDFFFRDDLDNFISVPDYIGISTPCKFSEFISKWAETMIPDLGQKALRDLTVLREILLKIFDEGKREHVVNYWGEGINGKRVYFNQRFLLTKNEYGDICALSIIKDYTSLKVLDEDSINSELEQYAYRDPITKGYNYIKFKEKVLECGVPGSIVCLDIHSFKVINSICGITKGDEVIKCIWEGILFALDLDKNDFAAHINADHYIIFLPTFDENVIIKKIKNISVSLLVISVDMDVPQIQPYFGISKWQPGKKIEMSYNEAIIAKHNAKYQQNMDYAFFNEEDTNRLIREKEMIDSFESALAKKEFKIWFQPKYTPKTRKLVGAEALARWIKSDGSVIRPDEFIPLFERNNMIRRLDEYIFRNVCSFQKQWNDEKKPLVPVSVNLSRASLYYKGVTEEYKRITEIYNVDPKLIPIEITESAAIKDDVVKDAIDRFHENGFSLQMDDFGSGYSSLSSLNLMHFDTLKLDKSLVDFIGEFGGNRLIEHTISLAKELGIQITAEGVETEAQVRFLKNIGCDSIQGFFYSKPVPSADFEKLLDKNYFGGNPSRIDLVEDHIYEFNQSYYKPALYSFVVNLSKNQITDYTEYGDWVTETQIDEKNYSDGLKAFVEKKVHPSFKDSFLKLLNREFMLAGYSGVDETRIAEYKRSIRDKMYKMRIVIHEFKVPDSADVWMYLKIFSISKED